MLQHPAGDASGPFGHDVSNLHSTVALPGSFPCAAAFITSRAGRVRRRPEPRLQRRGPWDDAQDADGAVPVWDSSMWNTVSFPKQQSSLSLHKPTVPVPTAVVFGMKDNEAQVQIHQIPSHILFFPRVSLPSPISHSPRSYALVVGVLPCTYPAHRAYVNKSAAASGLDPRGQTSRVVHGGLPTRR